MKAKNSKIVVQKMNKYTVEDFLNQLGLSDLEIKLFTSLIKKGAQTILDLSRNTEINRTKIYRIIDEMKKQGLIEEIVDENRRLAKAVDLPRLELLVKNIESKAKTLRNIFPNVSSIISSVKETFQPGTRVIFHRGVDGIKQMVWNTLSAKTEVVGYTYRRLDEIVGKKFSQEWHEEWVRRNLKMRDIYSDEYFKSLKKEKRIKYSSKNFQSRYIPSKILNVNHQVDIYNDVIAYYNWFEGEVFGVEISNRKIFVMQKQLFEIVWKMATP
ncbi:MAG: hypothetical protein US40_C0013G0016 [Candidatus Roizmanbacteria bacterium GW2011_GWC2_37_13]|uniref:Transcription regulator TrmB N-terminal domain-containing protein n=1 Tax=Candidatus Roizmanbacteria bacterium GW2011_GWC2_37_13 TaxID=1618486 RepID=A0A0G0IKY3_9BACT|nr:MAG: homoserine kinase, homoserine kinase type II [Candidatus Roizmanbacteria bacterium GW2011_GWC1_37_12]KKQ24884.1 MAG: hypothetical protein US40_C0013G0016 [Candidatus Roizmanbacteria bacterium GW2011_GWC2_37_13]